MAPKQKTPDVSHPVARSHPVTRRKALYVSESHTARIEGMPDDESAELLAALMKQVLRPEFAIRHRWRAGDFLVWDNSITLHKATMDYDGSQRRRLHRTGTQGDVPTA